MNEERLEEITRKFLDEGYTYNRYSTEPQKFDYDMEWVLKYAKEQAERSQRLEEENGRYRAYLKRLQRATERYPAEDMAYVVNKVIEEALREKGE